MTHLQLLRQLFGRVKDEATSALCDELVDAVHQEDSERKNKALKRCQCVVVGAGILNPFKPHQLKFLASTGTPHPNMSTTFIGKSSPELL